MPPTSSTPSGSGQGALTYIKHAFLYHWNLLLFAGGTALAALSPWPDAALPILGGLELLNMDAVEVPPV